MPPSVRWRRVDLVDEARGLLLREPVEVAVRLACLQLVEQADALADGHEVREHAAQPALVDVGHLGARGLLGDGLLGLLLGAHEEDRVATGDGVGDERRAQPRGG